MRIWSKMVSFLSVIILSVSTAEAAEVDAYFDGTKLVVPHLIVGGEIYAVTFELMNPAELLFKVDLSLSSDLTNTIQENVDPSAIFGSWTRQGAGVDQVQITFNADGTYSQFQTQDDDIDCTTGSETGTYQWQPSTGVLIIHTLTDTNGPCGLSHPEGGYFRFVFDGGTLNKIHFNEVTPLVRVN